MKRAHVRVDSDALPRDVEVEKVAREFHPYVGEEVWVYSIHRTPSRNDWNVCAVSRGEIGKQLENAIVHLTPLNIEKQTLLEVVGVECLLSEELLRVNVCVNRHFPSEGEY